MITAIGWILECTNPGIVWVNGEPVKCEHKHRTVEAAVACIGKRLRQNTTNDATLTVSTGDLSLPIKVGHARELSQRITVNDLAAQFAAAGLQTQQCALTKRLSHDQPDGREYGPHTLGTTSLQSIVDAINLGVV